MKIAVLSDTHIPTRLGSLPGRVCEVCAGSDLVIHAGDIVEASVLRELQLLAPVRAVHGNMDPYDLRSRLTESLELELKGSRVFVTHGTGARQGIQDRMYRRFARGEPDILIFGHSHVYHEETRNGVLLLNPGAVSGGRGDRSMALLTLEESSAPKVEKVPI